VKIGYSVEGSTDRAFLMGLQTRWCPLAEMIPGHFRGETGESLRRELRQICEELAIKSVDAMVFLTDSNDRPWRDFQHEMRQVFPQERRELAILGVAERNVECWICQDVNYVATKLNVPSSELAVPDPKGRFESAIGMSATDKKESEIASLVEEAPLRNWLTSDSFNDFYEQVRDMGQRHRCAIQNLRDRHAV